MDTLINDVISVIAVRKESATKLKSDIKNNFFSLNFPKTWTFVCVLPIFSCFLFHSSYFFCTLSIAKIAHGNVFFPWSRC